MLVRNQIFPLLPRDPGHGDVRVRDAGPADSDVAPSITATNTRVGMARRSALGLHVRAYTLPRGTEAIGVLVGSTLVPRAAEAWNHWLGGPGLDRVDRPVERRVGTGACRHP